MRKRPLPAKLRLWMSVGCPAEGDGNERTFGISPSQGQENPIYANWDARSLLPATCASVCRTCVGPEHAKALLRLHRFVSAFTDRMRPEATARARRGGRQPVATVAGKIRQGTRCPRL
jgi:hypothetical protein